MFGLEKYLIMANIALSVVLAGALGLYHYDTTTKHSAHLNKVHQDARASTESIVQAQNRAIEQLVSINNALSLNAAAEQKRSADVANRLNEINGSIGAVNDRFRKLPRPIVCQFLN